MLDGYDNLAKLDDTMVFKVGGSPLITELTDLNLETKLDTAVCTVGASCELRIALPEPDSPYGVYKIILYGPTETSDVAGWEAEIKLLEEAPGSRNSDGQPCSADTTTSSGTDSFTFTCDLRTAATSVVLTTTSYKDLAEVIVAGHLWTEFPCPPGEYSVSGTYTLDTSTTCKPCETGTYQDLLGQKFCRPSRFEKMTLTDGVISTYRDSITAPFTWGTGVEVHDVVIKNINFDEYSSKASGSDTDETAEKGACAATLSGYEDSTCVLKVKGATVTLIGDSDSVSPALTDQDNTGTSVRSQTYVFKPSSPVENVKRIEFSKSFLLAELDVYVAPTSDYYLRYNDGTGATEALLCSEELGPNTKVGLSEKISAKTDLTSCVLCPAGAEKTIDVDKEFFDSKIKMSVFTCEPCVAGQYREDGYDGKCKDCTSGHVTESDGLAICTICPKGTYEVGLKECTLCADGKVTKQEGLTVCTVCVEEGLLSYANSDQSDCETCEVGKVPNTDRTDCEDCEAGRYRDSSLNACADCPAPKIAATTGLAACNECVEGTAPNAARTVCVACPAGKYRGAGDTTCKPCAGVQFSENAGSAACEDCPVGEVPNTDKDGCDECAVGMYRGSGDAGCVVCAGGYHTDGETGQSECIMCSKGQKTETIPSQTGIQCVDCLPGSYSAADGTATCSICASPKVTLTEKQHECVLCELGTVYVDSKTCKTCPVGEYNEDQDKDDGVCKACESPLVTLTEKQSECVLCEKGNGWETPSTCRICVAGEYSDEGLCKSCPHNHVSTTDGLTECTLCPNGDHSDEKATICLPCEEEGTMKEAGVNELQWQKCVADEGVACTKQDVDSVYGLFQDVSFMRAGKSEEKDCLYDEADPTTNLKPKAKFSCELISETDAAIKPTYNCIKTPNTAKIEALTEEITAENTDDASSQLNDFASEGAAGIGDIAAAADVLEKIAQSATEVSEAATENIVSAVSSMAAGDLVTDDIAQKQEISKKMVANIKEIAKRTAVSNKLIKSVNVAIMKVQNEDGAKDISFFLPDAKDLTQLGQPGGGGEEGGKPRQPSIAIGSATGIKEMSVVLISGDAFFPTKSTGPLPAGNSTSEVRDTLWSDLKDEFDPAEGAEAAESLKFVNSVVLEIDVGEQEAGFVLNLYIKPNFQIGDTANNMKKMGNRRVQIKYICAWYDNKAETAEWKTDGCETIYDSSAVEAGVVCSCSHNTSFAVLMAAEEIDPGYLEVQSLMSQILLGGSVLGLIATIGLILPASAIVTTRSAKVNICFSIALLLASLLFLLQDIFIKADNTGLIQLKSIGCAVYTMLQHYMWLVVFMWTMIEGFLMYLSLVQVFGSHISNYMLKFNLVAYGVPIVFPLAGYFAFTKKITVGGVEVVDHQYMAETMCFLKPGTINFYALFFGPLILAIIVNLVFFGLVLKVIRNSKNANLSDKEQLMRQMKAAVGVMVLLGTGWVLGVFMNIPAPGLQITLQYLFIVFNASQGIFVFVFYVLLNDGVKSFWLEKLGMNTAAAPKSGGGASTATNVYANASTSKQEADHTYSNAAEFPAKKDDNANL
ncbi:uncharacterized protein LOC134825280 [Bolinopsis microptera]|uniref:uncharacterized protein LOC134825280 n=1 Tax=Bolinopsis microptera TaxID=2820187 RepID=UPI00307A38F6